MRNTERIKPHIRWMIRRDLKEFFEIENESFERPWTEDEVLAALRKRNCIAMVAEHGEKVVGYMIYELRKQKYELLKFAVHPDYLRCGVGTALLKKLQSKLDSDRRNRIVTRLHEVNLAGHLFLKRLGFTAMSVDRGYYDGEDAYRFVYYHPTMVEA